MSTYKKTKIAGLVDRCATPGRLANTGSCFDAPSQAARRGAPERAGTHPALVIDGPLPRWVKQSCSYEMATPRPDPRRFLRRGEGIPVGAGRLYKALRADLPRPRPPSAGAMLPRPNPPNTAFRHLYLRGDLPVAVCHTGTRQSLTWRHPPAGLDYHHYLPLFFDGLREKEDPLRFLAVQGCEDLLRVGGDKVLPTVPQLVIPLKAALGTRDPEVVSVALRVLQKLCACADLVGEALVPYYRQLLPVLSLYRGRTKSLGDGIDYGQRDGGQMGELVDETLALLEETGGPDAFVNLKYMVPTWESSVA